MAMKMKFAAQRHSIPVQIVLGWFLVVGPDGAPNALANEDVIAKPNVVVILCDDLGYGDLGCFGHPHIQTPNLDRLASSNIRLTDCYASSPVCSSSRAGLMTGRNPNRCGVFDWIPPRSVVHLLPDEVTTAKLLKGAGYDTAMVGKWHLNGWFNDDRQTQPGDHGFDYWMATQNNASPSHAYPDNFVRNGQPVGKLTEFSCQAVASDGIRWLESRRQSKAPFYLHVCFHEPHEPVASPDDLVARYRDLAINEDQAQYFANVTNLDDAVGRLLTKLDELGVADDTFVFFTSDNGPETLKRYARAKRSYGTPGRLREMKLHVYEGGIRVPGILRLPAAISGPKGDVSVPVSGVDLLPTLCALAGMDVPEERAIDGVDMLPLLRGDAKRDEVLHWMYYRALTEPKFALRDGKWKLLATWMDSKGQAIPAQLSGSNVNEKAVREIESSRLGEFELYDLQADLSETTDVVDEHLDVAKRLIARAKELHAEVIADAPNWFPVDSGKSKR